MREVLFLAVAGALGSLSRYGLCGLAQRITSTGFPFGTLLVNILGSALLGFVMQASLSTDIIPRSFRVAVTIGFLGAFTTFSTFSYETAAYIKEGAWMACTANIAANVGLSLLAVLLGILLGRMAFGNA